LRSAYLREELRNKIFRRICRSVLVRLQDEGIPAIVLKGTALADTAYSNPVLRHSHDIELLANEADMARASSLFPSLGFNEIEETFDGYSHHFTLVHESRLPVQLHSRLFPIPYPYLPLAQLWNRSQCQVIADTPAQILSPEDNLLHICAHASYSRSRESLRWVTDAWFILHRHRNLDWDHLFALAQSTQLALPLSVTLGYLAEALDAPVPMTFLNRLHAAAVATDKTFVEAAILGALQSPEKGIKFFLCPATDWRTRKYLAEFLLFPSSQYLQRTEGIRFPSLLPLYYIYRPARFAARRVWWTFKRLNVRGNF
jgi:hypothetical protein